MKTVRYLKPLAAPRTEVEELQHRLHDLTGEVYLPVPVQYCPVCGENKRGRLNSNQEVTSNE